MPAIADAPTTADAPIIPAQAVTPAENVSPSELKEFAEVFGNPSGADTKKKDHAGKDELGKGPKVKPEKTAKPDVKSGRRIDSLAELKLDDIKDEPATKEKAEIGEKPQLTEDEPIPADQKKAQTRWLQLRAAEKELNSLKPNFEAIRKELDAVKEKGLIPESVQQKLDRLEQRYAEELVEQDEGFQRDVAAPIRDAFTTIGDVAKASGLDQMQAQALLQAVRETSEVVRSDAIWEIISSVRVKQTDKDSGETEEIPLPDDKITRYATKIINAADSLHKQHWPKEVEYRFKAKEIADARRAADAQEGEAQKAQKEQEWSEERARVATILKERLPYVFEKHPEAEEAIKSAVQPAELADRIYDAQAGHMLAYMAKTLSGLLSENKSLKASLSARDASRPKADGGSPPPSSNGKDANSVSWEEAFGGRR